MPGRPPDRITDAPAAGVDRSHDYCQLDDAEVADLLARDAATAACEIEAAVIRKARMYAFRWKAGMP